MNSEEEAAKCIEKLNGIVRAILRFKKPILTWKYRSCMVVISG